MCEKSVERVETMSAIRTLVACIAAGMSFTAHAFLFNIPTEITEYYNTQTGHYFLATILDDVNALESGAKGPWRRTGFHFQAWSLDGAEPGANVCRFYAAGPDSYFYTGNADECASLKAHPESGWAYQGIFFHEYMPVNGACEYNEIPVYRLYNNRAQFNDSNHRYVAATYLVDVMVAQGWTNEGIVFCADEAGQSPTHSYSILANHPQPLADCLDESYPQRSCTGVTGISPSFPNLVTNWLPYSPLGSTSAAFTTHGPNWSPVFSDLTGDLKGDLYTAQAVSSGTTSIAAHSFIQLFPAQDGLVPVAPGGSFSLGTHLTSIDATQPLAGIEPLYLFATAAPAAGAVDTRVFPWRLTHDNLMDFYFTLIARTVKRADPASHGYGAAMLAFRDAKSGDNVVLTMLTYGTVPPGDFVGALDPATREVYVSTAFGATTLFGQSLQASFIGCDGSGPCATAAPQSFRFRLAPADFAHALALARGSNPALSGDPADYFLVSMRFRNGVLGAAEVGTWIAGVTLDVYGY